MAAAADDDDDGNVEFYHLFFWDFLVPVCIAIGKTKRLAVWTLKGQTRSKGGGTKNTDH